MLSREEALQWCFVHLVEWPEVKPSIAPDGWCWYYMKPDELFLFTKHGKDGERCITETIYDLRKKRVEEFKTFISDTHSINKLITKFQDVEITFNDIKLNPINCRSAFDSTKIVQMRDKYRNQFLPSSFSFKYLMKNVHKMARP